MHQANYRIIFNRKKNLNAQGKALVHIEISYKRKRKYISTGIYITPDQWDDKKRKIKERNNASFLMDQIRKIIRKCEDYEMRRQYEQLPYTIEDIAAMAKNKHRHDDFIAFLEADIEKGDISEQTRKHHRTTLQAIKNFGRINSWQDLTYENIDEFNFWLLSAGLSINTVANYHKNLKSHITRAIQKNIYDAGKNPYIKYKVKRIKKSRQALKEDELRQIEQLDLTGMDDSIIYACDLFLFSCYTGLRYSDIMNMHKENIIFTREGIQISLTPEKTSDMSGITVKLPLWILFDGKPQKILEKYYTGSIIFPPITNQHLNRHLKIISMASKIHRRLTFHMARHTFGTLLANKLGDPFLIKSLMGHRKIETSMQYIHESQASNEAKLKKINWF